MPAQPQVPAVRQDLAVRYRGRAAANPVRCSARRHLAAAKTAKNELLFIVPFDYLCWTEKAAKVFTALDEKAAKIGVDKGKKILWTTGAVSKQTRDELQKRGWKIEEKIEGKMS